MAKDLKDYTQEELIEYINELRKQLTSGKYGLYWDKSIEKEKIVEDCLTKIPVLERERERTILNCNGEDNILIEGDNFHALTALNMIAPESIDIIYIDPPYNTGHEDFTYNDKFVNSEDGFVHSKWLSFMEARLKLAKTLLKESGLIFISIDDNEMATLKLLCDSIFGEKNFVANIVNQSANSVFGSKAANKNRTFIKVKDYVLVYKKGEILLNPLYIESKNNLFYDHELIYDGKEIYKTVDYFKEHYKETFEKYKLTVNKDNIEKVFKIDEEFRKKVVNELLDIQFSSSPYVKKDLTEEEIDQLSNGKIINHNGIYLIKEGNGNGLIRFLRSLRESCHYVNGELRKCDILGDVWNTSPGYGNINAEGDVVFKNGKKPLLLLKNIIKSSSKKDSTILDFFAGSGTTGQAVMELNKEDGGHRKFILCTNNENNICSDITYPRLKTCITGIRQDGSKYSDGLSGNNLVYYKTIFVRDENNTEQAKYSLMEKIDELLCIKEDIFIEVSRTDYSSHFKSADGTKHMLIYNDYFNPDKFAKFTDEIKAANGTKIVYVYSSDNNVDETLLKGMEGVEMKTIPSKIYEIYKEIVEDIKRGE